MKKITSMFLVACMLVSLAACSSSSSSESTTAASSAESETEASSEADSDTSAEEETTAEADVSSDVPANADEAEAQGRTVLVMNNHNSLESTNGQFTQYFVDYVNENSDTLYIDVYYNGELGGIQETLEGAIMGTIDIGGCSMAQLASFYQDMEVWSMPYLYTDPMDGAKICDLDQNELLSSMIEECNEAAGLTVFAPIYSIDARQLTCNFAVYSPDDLAGQKIRSITNDVYTMCIEGMGATPVPIDWTETIAALTTGTVVGEENPYSTIVSYQLWDCQDYIMETNHMFDLAVQYINTDKWDNMTEEEQQVLKDGVAAMQEYQNGVIEASLDEYKQTCLDNGMTIITEEDGLDLDAFKSSVDALKEENYPQYSEYFSYIDEYLANYQE